MNLLQVLPTAVIWVPQGTGLPSLDLPATSQPVQKIPRLGNPQGCRAVEGGASPFSGIPSPSESFHCKNVSYAKGCTKNVFPLVLLLPFTLLRLTCQALWAASRQGQGVCAGGHSAHTRGHTKRQINRCNTQIHSVHIPIGTHRYMLCNRCRDMHTCTDTNVDVVTTQIHKQTQLHTHVDAHTDVYK